MSHRASVVVLAACAVLAVVTPASADDDFAGASVIFARGDALYRVDPRGRSEAQVAALPAKAQVRALRTDARGQVLLADIGGTWSWMRLDGSASALAALPCAEGPAQLAVDGTCVLCRSSSSPTGSVIVNLATGKQTPVAVPPPGARLVGEGAKRRLVWADASGVWSAPPANPKAKQQVAADAPLRSFLPSPDGTRAVGVFLDKVYESLKSTKPAELLMTFALDGQAARRKAIKDGVPIEWSHDNHWVLVQDRGSACIMSATGGQYKCWKGYTGASIASDGKWALILGSRDAKTTSSSTKSSKKDKKRTKDKKNAPKDKKDAPDEPSGEAENRGGDDPAGDDVQVAPPSGPLALFRAKLDGAFTEAPARIIGIVDGAAVWVPAPAAP